MDDVLRNLMTRMVLDGALDALILDAAITADCVVDPEESEPMKRYREADAVWEKAQSRWFDHAMHLYLHQPAMVPHDGCTCDADLGDAFKELGAARQALLPPETDKHST